MYSDDVDRSETFELEEIGQDLEDDLGEGTPCDDTPLTSFHE